MIIPLLAFVLCAVGALVSAATHRRGNTVVFLALAVVNLLVMVA